MFIIIKEELSCAQINTVRQSYQKYAYYEAEEIYREIGTSKDGLTGEQVEMMQQRYGVNSFITKKRIRQYIGCGGLL